MGKNIYKLMALTFLPFLLTAFTTTHPPSPELATGKVAKPLVSSRLSMVVTNNPWATKAGQEILRQGGNAIDAAIAAGFVLGLTEPQSSGIGGGGYALTYFNKKLRSYDGREIAPSIATPQWFLNAEGKAPTFKAAMLSAKSVGIPSEIALFYIMHKEQGKLPWEKLLQPAIKLAKEGFPMSSRLRALLIADQNVLQENPAIQNVYFSNGQVKRVGEKIINNDYAEVLEEVSRDPNSFYNGRIAKDIINTVNNKAGQPLFSLADFTTYKVHSYPAICSKFRKEYTVCSVHPSSSGGIALQELMGIYALNYQGKQFQDNQWVYHFLQASKLAYADRNQYIADPSFVKPPIAGLLDKNYLTKRARLVTDRALATPIIAGKPRGAEPQYAPDESPKASGTTSIAIVDKLGNAVSMTLTIEHQFGSHLFVDGFFLNNELTDFSLIPKDKQGKWVVNRVEAGKRPRSSIAASIIFKNGQLYGVVGSPGGNQIICYVAKNIILMLDMGMLPNQAVESPNLCAANADPEFERDTSLIARIPSLKQMGERILITDLVSGETNIIRSPQGWLGAADPRREGMALGE